MDFGYIALTLLSPLWVPFLLTAIYAFGVRTYIPKARLPLMDNLYWGGYALAILVAVTLFILEIWGWQLTLTYRFLWLVILGIPMLFGVFFMVFLSIMASDSW